MSANTSYVDTETLKRLSRLSPWRTALALAADWLIIALAIFACEWSGSWLVYLVAIPVIAGGMHGLGALLHEFAHFRAMPNKVVSDAIGDALVAWPLLATAQGYRRNHIDHHRYTNTGQDPDWVVKVGKRRFTFPQEMRFALLNVLGYLVGISSLRDMREILKRIQSENPLGRGYRIVRLSYYVAIGVGITALGWWQEAILYWIVPYCTVFFFLLYIRSVAEHFGPTMEHDHQLTHTRTVVPYPLEAWFFAPHGLNYHLEHHLYPSVPFYRLRALHMAVMQDEAYRAKAHVTRGYTTGLLREVWLDAWWRRKFGTSRKLAAAQ